ncbi:zeta-carotene desaturase [Actinidia rufa]|uniref:Zeta-carotene desaturase n=1 Tax=Actinidia rufa TaxID=165716 RepID=A0A7J0FVZ8_9ERIC|nr:zeta-carotene desaturase [Actinidia rufa]
MATSSLCFPATSGLRTDVAGIVLSGRRRGTQLKPQRFDVRCSLDDKVSDMSVNAPKGLFPPEPEYYQGPKLKVAIIGAGLAGMSTAVELLDQGHEVQLLAFMT